VVSGESEIVLKGHSGWVLSVAFSHNSFLVVSGSEDKTIRIWDLGAALGVDVSTSILKAKVVVRWLTCRHMVVAVVAKDRCYLHSTHQDWAARIVRQGWAKARRRL
jgi:WD40 repeat protein